ncbi:MAG: hypothetical protein MRQ09_00445 [Candidatus Midichloria sp.]|nr:hypothetical protein [Candidatus Midichloria sp.]
MKHALRKIKQLCRELGRFARAKQDEPGMINFRGEVSSVILATRIFAYSLEEDFKKSLDMYHKGEISFSAFTNKAQGFAGVIESYLTKEYEAGYEVSFNASLAETTTMAELSVRPKVKLGDGAVAEPSLEPALQKESKLEAELNASLGTTTASLLDEYEAAAARP